MHGATNTTYHKSQITQNTGPAAQAQRRPPAPRRHKAGAALLVAGSYLRIAYRVSRIAYRVSCIKQQGRSLHPASLQIFPNAKYKYQIEIEIEMEIEMEMEIGIENERLFKIQNTALELNELLVEF
jgi:hypothetical protein